MILKFLLCFSSVYILLQNYIHRSGRTARASKEGLSVVLIGPQDVKDYKKIMHTLNKSKPFYLLPILSVVKYFRSLAVLFSHVIQHQTCS